MVSREQFLNWSQLFDTIVCKGERNNLACANPNLPPMSNADWSPFKRASQ